VDEGYLPQIIEEKIRDITLATGLPPERKHNSIHESRNVVPQLNPVLKWRLYHPRILSF